MKVAVIGAGIGGLTVAMALKKAGIPFRIFEAAPVIQPVGAGIIIANNAMQVFRYFGIDQAVGQKGNPIRVTNLAKPDFTPLSYIPLHSFEKKFQLQNHAIHRADLHRILMDTVGNEYIDTNKKLTDIRRNLSAYELFFEDGSVITAEFIIGADGIKSIVRQLLFNENVYRNAGQSCWRGVLNFQLPESYRHELVEAWGRGRRFGFVQINEREVYWYLLINTDLLVHNASLPDLVHSFHPLATQLIKNTSPDKIIRADLYDIKPVHRWYNNKVCLLGDAAHATTPNLGQGACQAIEDAYVLSRLLEKNSIEKSMHLYPEIRRKKAHGVVNLSWNFGKIAHLNHPFAVSIRNLLLRVTPLKANLRQMNGLFTLDEVEE
jgi:2-polyprenyl-6-methoxyphenol hydroxylase-like FAD-dependent oxidoreductase